MAERYEFVRKVAQGGFGEVYTALDRTLKREVAIKRLLNKNDGAAEEEAEAAFQREALVLAAMQHPNIVQIFDFDRDEDGTFVVMEMLEGKTLKEALDRGALTWEDFTRLVRQTLDAMVAAHKADILHRDLKPENIFLKRTITGSWTVKVLDFGLAKLSQTPSRQTMDGKGNVFGSIYYMAPEQFRREPLDARTDIYALGCVFYQALTQRFPFEGENMAGTMDAHLNHQVKSVEQRRKDTPPAIAAWLNRMISLDRNERPSSANMARREFDEALEGKVPAPVLKSAAAAVSRPSSTPTPPPAPVARPPMSGASARQAAYAANGSGMSGGTAVAAPPAAPRATHSQRSAPARATSGVVTVNPRVLSTAAVTRPAEAKTGWKKHQNLILAGVPVLLAGGFFLFLSQRSDEGKSSAGVKTEATSKPVSPAAPASPPKPSEPPIPTALSLTLPFEDKLTWRFRGGVEIWNQGDNGQQGRKTPLRNQRIHSWRNLAPSLKEVYMRPHGSVTDNAPNVSVGDINGPGTESARLGFNGNQGMRHQLDSSVGLKAPGNGVSGSKGVTLAAVFRANASKKDKSIRPLLVSSSFSKDSISIHHSHIAGQYWVRVQHGPDLVLPLVRPKQFEAKGSPWAWSVVVAVWNSAEGKIRLSVRSPDGQVVKADEITIPKGMPMMDQITIGYYPLPSDTKLEPNEKFDGDIVDVAVYQDALDSAGQEKLMNAMWDCYFPKR
ncbi:serine/threonine protein kinase [Roseimicrobium gellanilyticum]|uniref:Serine/threonine protein kinase n=1 Tax=Roseimicrobium gellanilyticum TaxID=748857 RepID=A0A366HSD0_9BACT|nr:serine/threonine-protein kinase [Roseimicrobium gellanilyticum]RBP45803.1 serine/threonine protein kinase [Roseimicrobium gellanilyticum]